MKKRNFLIIMTVSLAFIILAGCKSFNGNITSDSDSFYMDYSVFNRQEDAFINLSDKDKLQVEIAQTEGNIDVTIGMDGEEPIYQGNALTEISFTLNINKKGRYRISVTGNNAKGYVSFERG